MNGKVWHGWKDFPMVTFMRVLVTDPGRAATLGSQGEYGWDGWLGCYFANAPQRPDDRC
ncbi:MAG: hypothetical protein ACLSHW_02460 [Lachnospiraceae bacterium]